MGKRKRESEEKSLLACLPSVVFRLAFCGGLFVCVFVARVSIACIFEIYTWSLAQDVLIFFLPMKALFSPRKGRDSKFVPVQSIKVYSTV